MEVPNQEEAEMPIPLNSTYGGGGHGHVHVHGHPIIHHHHHHPSHNNQITTIPPSSSSSSPPPHPHQIIPPMDDDNNHAVIVPFKRMPVIKYRECLKNHAASMGGNANDGCGEFMPSGEEGTLEALTCSACSCHRNFHRKEIDGGSGSGSGDNPITGRKVFVGHHHPHHHHHHAALGYHHQHHSRPQHQMIMSYNMGGGGGGSLPSESDEQDGGGGGGGGGVVRPTQLLKKRFRTKFSQEQKEKMLSFAERVGWKIQKQEEGVVQNFCQEIGVKRRVLKVWMHNNKHSLAKKNANHHHSVDHGGGDDGDQNQV